MKLAKPKAWFMVFRVLPVMVWSGMAATCGLAIARMEGVPLNWTSFILVAIVTALVQGFPAHIINEIYDWQSGADAYQPLTRKSGGSKVIKAGFASIGDLWVMLAVTSVPIVGLAILVCVTVDIRLAVFIAGGICAAVFYTLPPFRFAYRPFAGEWLGGFPGIFLAVTGSYFAQTHGLSELSLVTGAGLGAVYVAIMIFFHYLDVEGDRATGKRTTVVVLGPAGARWYAIACLVVAGALFAACALHTPSFALLVLEAATLVALYAMTDPRSPDMVVRNGRRITYAAVGGALLFGVAADLRLAVMGVVALGAYALHYTFGKLRRAA